MRHHHPRHTARCIVLAARLLRLQQRLQFAQDCGERFDDLGVGRGVLRQQADAIGRVGFRLGVFVAETVEEQAEEWGGGRCDSGAHATDAFGDDAD